MIFGDFNRIIFRDFKEKKPADEFQMVGMLANLGAQALVNTYDSICVLTNIKGLYEEWLGILGLRVDEKRGGN